MNLVSVAQRLMSKVTIKGISRYGLGDVTFTEDRLGYLSYRLRTNALDYNREDPLRPTHEVVRMAIEGSDRLLLGQLIRVVLNTVARTYGVNYFYNNNQLERKPRRVSFSIINRSRDARGRLKMCLHILHYVVRLSRNLKEEWGSLDVGRHAAIFNIGDLVLSLSNRKDTSQAIDLSLFAIMHIALDYSKIKPYGRVEPGNILFAVCEVLHSRGHSAQAELCAEIMGVIRERTEQLSDPRIGDRLSDLPDSMRKVIEETTQLARSNTNFLPGNTYKDPWRTGN